MKSLALVLLSIFLCHHIALGKSRPVEIVDRAPVEAVLTNPSHPHHAWVKEVAGSIMRVNGASGVLLSDHSGAKIFMSAYHVLGPSPAANQSEVPLELGFLRGRPIHLPDFFGSSYYPVFLPGLPDREWEQNYRNLRPGGDFFVGRIEHSSKIKRISSAVATSGEPVIVLGFPTARGGALSYSIGHILDQKLAKTIYDSDPTERFAKFEPEAEFVISAPASGGMSGGGVFDRHGRLLGLVTRGVGDGYTRVVRATHVQAQIESHLHKLPQSLREEMTKALGPQSTNCNNVF